MLLRHRPVLVLLFGSIVFVFGGIGWFFSPRLHTFHPANPDTAPLLQERAGWRTLVTRTTREPHFGQLPPLADGGATKWALLVGVTRYDHLAAQVHLRGSGNDVDLMRATLVGRYGFPPVNVVSLTESEGKPDLRPTRANIAREFRRLAQKAKAGDQVVILLAGHGARQPESDPPDPVAPEPDGIDEIFLPADVKPWAGYPGRVPNAIADKELRDWLAAITAKKAYVWAIFDCCHSGTMTRSTEVVRQLPNSILVPEEELNKARARAAKRTGRPAPDQGEKGRSAAPPAANDYLVATFACREYETTPECRQPADSPAAAYHGLLTYSVVSALEQSAASVSPLTYRELTRRVQSGYLARPQASPTPSTEGMGQVRVVLGIASPVRPRITLTRVKGEPVVNVGDLHGVTRGSVLRVHSLAGEREKPRILGYVRVEETRPLDSTVAAVEYEGTAKPASLPTNGLCELAAVDYSVGRLRIGIESGGKGSDDFKREVVAALRALSKENAGQFQVVEDLTSAHFLLRLSADDPELQVASGKRPSIPLPSLNSERFGEMLSNKLTAIHRARSLINVGARLEGEGSRGPTGRGVNIEVLGHRGKNDPGRVLERPAGGWVFRPGDRVSFRVTNTSKTKRLEVTLLIVDPDYQIHLFYPAKNEINKALEPGASFSTGAGTITDKPPFGPEQLVAIITSPTNPPVDYGLLTQPGIRERGYTSTSPIAQLLDCGMWGSGSRSGLKVSEFEDQNAQILNWRTEPMPKK